MSYLSVRFGLAAPKSAIGQTAYDAMPQIQKPGTMAAYKSGEAGQEARGRPFHQAPSHEQPGVNDADVSGLPASGQQLAHATPGSRLQQR